MLQRVEPKLKGYQLKVMSETEFIVIHGTVTLTNPQLLVDLPSGPGTNHQGGKLKIGPDNQLYVVVGEMQRKGHLQNFQSGPAPDDTGVILRVNPADGSPSPGNPLSSDPSDPLSKYYAYGIRNSFGIDFNPVTGKLWDAEKVKMFLMKLML